MPAVYNEIYKIIMELMLSFGCIVCVWVWGCCVVYRSSRISSAPQRTIFDINLEVPRNWQILSSN